MNLNTINELINCLKMIVSKDQNFQLPKSGLYDNLDLKSANFSFIVDINRKGRKKPKFTLQLRDQRNKDKPLLRLDVLGPDHPNPEGQFPYSGEVIPCPHIHIAHPEYGDSIAYPLNEEYARMYLNDDELSDLVLILKGFLIRCNVGNIKDVGFEYQAELI